MMNKRLFVGTYSEGTGSSGLYELDVDAAKDRIDVVATCGAAPNPSYLVQSGNRIYAACEVCGKAVLADYRIDSMGRDASGMRNALRSEYGGEASVGIELTRLRCMDSGAGTCFALLHPMGHRIYGANYESGSMCSCELMSDGGIGSDAVMVNHRGSGADAKRQASAHVHTLSFVPGTHVLAAVDLGCDAIVLYDTDEEGNVILPPREIVHTSKGFGPRIIAYHPHLRMAALVGELTCEVILYRYDEDGLRWSPCMEEPMELADTRGGRSLAAHIQFAGDGHFLYVSTRGADIITMLSFDDAGRVVGRMDMPCAGNGPRHFSLSPDERYMAVANQTSGDVTIFDRDLDTGLLKHPLQVQIPQPSCVVWDELR